MTIPIIHTEKLSKFFGGVKAVIDVSLDLWKDEILGLVGDNAAGKSTLLKTLAGVHQPTSGHIFIEKKEAKFNTPADARKWGIEMVYQDLALCPNLDVASNMYLGRELTKHKFGIFERMDKSRMEEESERRLREIGINISSLRTQARNLSGGQQQAVAVGRAFVFNPKVVLMDEPLASMAVTAREKILNIVREFKRRGISIVIVSHVLEDVFSVADRIAVMRHGKIVAEKPTEETTVKKIVTLMHGV